MEEEGEGETEEESPLEETQALDLVGEAEESGREEVGEEVPELRSPSDR